MAWDDVKDGPDQPTDQPALVAELRVQSTAVHNGDMRRAEAMLVNQAHTLDAIFNALARRAHQNIGQYLGATETYLRLALKAQSQCRTTLETLSIIKNPRQVAFVRANQANVTTGPQQVNNGGVPARAGESESEQNKLLEHQHERLDIGAARAAGATDSALATVGEINGPEVLTGQGAREPERL